MRVRPKGAVREAWQYQAGHKRPLWVMYCTEFSDGEMFLILRRRSGHQLMDYGDWLVQDLDGDPAWFTDEEFHQVYERAV